MGQFKFCDVQNLVLQVPQINTSGKSYSASRLFEVIFHIINLVCYFIPIFCEKRSFKHITALIEISIWT